MEKPLVSVLMVNYNHEDTIRESIESVLNQNYKELQFIIVDDGSTDSSCEVIEQFKDSRIELYKQKRNQHICYVTNLGLSKVKGDYLARIDSDDIWYPEKLEKQIQFLVEHPEYKICFSLVDIINTKSEVINDKDIGDLYEVFFKGQADCLEKIFFMGNCLALPSVLMKTEIMKEIGGFNLGYMQSHDFDYWVRVAKKYPIYVMQERLIGVRRFDKNDEKSNNSNTSEISSTRFYNEYMDIRSHYFDDMDNELFVYTFQKYFKCKESKSIEELECEKAFLLCTPCNPSYAIPPVGIQKFLELFQKEIYVNLLEEKFHFTIKDFYKLTGQHMYNDRILDDRRKMLQTENMELIKENSNLEKLINEYENSTSWKITKPLRMLMSKIKGRSLL